MTTRMKISVSLPRDLVAAVDDQARRSRGSNRSAVIEAWLRQAARRLEQSRLEEEVVAYYRSLDADARAEEQAIARGSSRAARRLVIDGARARRR